MTYYSFQWIIQRLPNVALLDELVFAADSLSAKIVDLGDVETPERYIAIRYGVQLPETVTLRQYQLMLPDTLELTRWQEISQVEFSNGIDILTLNDILQMDSDAPQRWLDGMLLDARYNKLRSQRVAVILFLQGRFRAGTQELQRFNTSTPSG